MRSGKMEKIVLNATTEIKINHIILIIDFVFIFINFIFYDIKI